MTCSHEECNFERHKNDDKCIFHCEKDNDEWLTSVRREWKKSKIKEFWEEIREKEHEISNDFSYFIFPRFEVFECDFFESYGKQQTKEYSCLDETNFGTSYTHSQYYSRVVSGNFSNAIFLDDADFSKISLEGYTDFSDVKFKKDLYFPSKDINQINFNEATFEKEISFEGFNINECDFNNVSFKDKASFQNTVTSDAISFNNSTFEKEAIFTGSSFGNSIDLSYVAFKEKLSLNNCKITGGLKINDSEVKGDANFQKLQVGGATLFENFIIIGIVDFSGKSAFSGIVTFINCTFEKEVIFTESTFSNSVDLSEITFKKNLLFDNCKVTGNLNVKNVKVKSETNFQKLEVGGETLLEYFTAEGVVDFSTKSIFSGMVKLTKCNFEKDLLLTELTFNSDMVLLEIIFRKSLFLNNCKIIGNLNIQNVEVKSETNFQKIEVGEETLFENFTVEGIADFSMKSAFSGMVKFGKCVFKKDTIFTDAAFSDSVNLLETTFDESLFLNNCKISGGLNIQSVVVKSETNFQKLEIGEETLFENFIVEGIVDFSMKSVFSEVVKFSKCVFEKDVIFTDSIFSKSIDLSETTFDESLFLNNCEIDNDLEIKYSKIEKDLYSNTLKIAGNSIFNNIEINGNVIAKSSIFDKNLIFDSITINGKLDFSLSEFRSDAEFLSIKIKENVVFNSCIFGKDITFKNTTLHGNVFFIKAQFGTDKNEDFEKIKRDEENRDFNIEGVVFGKTDFTHAIFLTNIEFKESEFDSLLFKRNIFSKWTELVIRSIKTSKLVLNKFVNESEIFIFDEVIVTKELEIKNISLNKEKFNHFDISTCDIEIENSSFNNDFFNSVKWGQITEKRYTAKRDVFRQLKFHSEQQKNFIDADGFYALEMKERKKELNEEIKKSSSTTDKMINFFSHTAIFYLHEKTSNFSQSWILPVFWISTIGMLSVIIKEIRHSGVASFMPEALISSVVLGMGYLWYKSSKIKPIDNLIHYTIFSIGGFLTFFSTDDPLDDMSRYLNPINIFKGEHATSFFKGEEFCYLITKIVILFLIYQTIIALKKKVRSK